MENSDILINVINECVEKALQKSNIPTKTMGTVISLTEDNTRAKVKVGGFDTSFELLNKTGEILSIDDKVFIESINGNLTNGFISERFGEARWIESNGLPTYVNTGGVVDLNDYTEQGWYFFTSNNTITNIPAGVNGWLKVVKDKDSGIWTKQMWYRAGTPNSNDYQTYVRTRTGDIWSNWKQYQMVEDTGWKTITLNSKFHTYGDNSANTPQYRKIGKTVYIRGAVAPYENQNSDGSGIVFANLPAEYRPSRNVYSLCQGTGTKIWLLTVYSDGDLMISRYRDGASWNTIYADHWFPFNATFLVD